MSGLPDVLRRIVDRRRERLGVNASAVAAGSAGAPTTTIDSPFLQALRRESPRAVIAEVKMGSPKLGDLRGRVDPEGQAELYARAGAAALSVVVEPDFFFGSYELLQRCQRASGLPAIAKDFVVDDRQLHWTAEAGATAVLLIAALYDAGELRRLAGVARELGLVPLVETHDAADLEKLEGSAWELVGVNNRDLRTFAVELERAVKMRQHLPPGALPVAESGIRSGEDVKLLRRAGYEAFLIGESLLLSEAPEDLLEELRS